MLEQPTEKQAARVKRLIDILGTDRVEGYIRGFYPEARLDQLNKQEAQKIITGLQTHESHPIQGVAMSMSWIQNQ